MAVLVKTKKSFFPRKIKMEMGKLLYESKSIKMY